MIVFSLKINYTVKSENLALELGQRLLPGRAATGENVLYAYVDLDGPQHHAHVLVADVPPVSIVGARRSAVEFDEVLTHSDEVHRDRGFFFLWDEKRQTNARARESVRLVNFNHLALSLVGLLKCFTRQSSLKGLCWG
jgi:hypothetical protein